VCQHRRGTDNTDRQDTQMYLQWFDKDMAPLEGTIGNRFYLGSSGIWRAIGVEGRAPTNAAFVQLVLRGRNNNDGGSHGMWWDAFTWNYVYQGAPSTMIFRAVQAKAGYSGANEPAWPMIVGAEVTDNEVIWKGVLTSRVVWEAAPLLVSGATEPAFPDAVGGSVLDNTIIWRAVSRRVRDEKAPSSSVVAIASSKIYAADQDIIPFSATINPLDWSSAEDAGYLPFGLQTYGANPVTALGLYRSNLVAFNAAAFQMWQVDQDPPNMALLDAIPIGCTFPKTVQPVSNDLAFLTALGIRSFGVAAASSNLQAGDFGKAIDPLVQEAIRALGSIEPFGLYYPAQGQYWVFFGAQAFVLTMNGNSRSWSRYVFPEEIVHWTVLGDDLYLRTASDKVWRISEEEVADDVVYDEAADPGIGFDGLIWWPYLELGSLGGSRMMHGFDLVGQGEVAVSFGYDQSNFALATPEYVCDAETLTGPPIPMPLAGPSFQMRLRFTPFQKWRWESSVIYLQDLRVPA
jgi:hypothetical protein